MTMWVKVEVFGNKPADRSVVPARILIRNRDWAVRLVERFNRRQERRAMNMRAVAQIDYQMP